MREIRDRSGRFGKAGSGRADPQPSQFLGDAGAVPSPDTSREVDGVHAGTPRNVGYLHRRTPACAQLIHDLCQPRRWDPASLRRRPGREGGEQVEQVRIRGRDIEDLSAESAKETEVRSGYRGVVRPLPLVGPTGIIDEAPHHAAGQAKPGEACPRLGKPVRVPYTGVLADDAQGAARDGAGTDCLDNPACKHEAEVELVVLVWLLLAAPGVGVQVQSEDRSTGCVRHDRNYDSSLPELRRGRWGAITAGQDAAGRVAVHAMCRQLGRKREPCAAVSGPISATTPVGPILREDYVR